MLEIVHDEHYPCCLDAEPALLCFQSKIHLWLLGGMSSTPQLVELKEETKRTLPELQNLEFKYSKTIRWAVV